MAIMAYTGVMGSGKTYEAVATAALTALRAGRRVVTNISGFNYEKIRDHLGPLEGGEVLQADKVVVIPSSRVSEPNFFFDPEMQAESIVRAGDLVLLDEVWHFWGNDAQLSVEHKKFFRMHRHYVEAGSGTSCDMVLMIQDLSSLHRFIRGVLETSFKFTKMKTLGLASKFRVEVYEGGRMRRATLVSSSVKGYDKKIFPLYKSYDGGKGKESVVDDRQNLFKNKWFLGSILAALCGLIYSGTWFYNYVGKLRNPEGKAAPSPAATVAPGVKAAAVPPGVTASAVNPVPSKSGDNRLVGYMTTARGETLMLVQLGDGRIVRQLMNGGVIDGWQTVAGYEGRMVEFRFTEKGK